MRAKYHTIEEFNRRSGSVFWSQEYDDFDEIFPPVNAVENGAAVTTNTTGLATNSINYYESSKKLDCFAFDYYPSLRTGRVGTFPYAFARGAKEGKRFWVLEFTSGGGHKSHYSSLALVFSILQ